MKDPGHADSYDQLSIKYIPGMKPELVIFGDDGTEVERHNLWGPDANRGLNSKAECPVAEKAGGCPAHKRKLTEEIHSFLAMKGFERNPEAPPLQGLVDDMIEQRKIQEIENEKRRKDEEEEMAKLEELMEPRHHHEL